MLLLGCRPKGRFTEQHDVFFGVAPSLKSLVPQLNTFWPEAKNNLHIDAWREVSSVDGYTIHVVPKAGNLQKQPAEHLFFLNLGGYKPHEFEEYHYKLLAVAADSAAAVKYAKQSLFYKHTGFKGAASHVDDTYGLDVDEVHAVQDILSPTIKENFFLEISPGNGPDDELHLGYLPTWKIKE